MKTLATYLIVTAFGMLFAYGVAEVASATIAASLNQSAAMIEAAGHPH